jgi:hypothetical protein
MTRDANGCAYFSQLWHSQKPVNADFRNSIHYSPEIGDCLLGHDVIAAQEGGSCGVLRAVAVLIHIEPIRTADELVFAVPDEWTVKIG